MPNLDLIQPQVLIFEANAEAFTPLELLSPGTEFVDRVFSTDDDTGTTVGEVGTDCALMTSSVKPLPPCFWIPAFSALSDAVLVLLNILREGSGIRFLSFDSDLRSSWDGRGKDAIVSISSPRIRATLFFFTAGGCASVGDGFLRMGFTGEGGRFEGGADDVVFLSGAERGGGGMEMGAGRFLCFDFGRLIGLAPERISLRGRSMVM